MSILQAVNRAGSLSMTDMAEMTSIPYPTTRRIVSTLVVAGMLEREPARKRYRPTVLVKSLAHGFQDHNRLIERARPHLVDLTRRHLWPVSLVTQVGQLMIVRDCTHSISPLAMNHYFPGATFPLLECASGHVYLAYVGDSQRRQLLKAAPTTDTPVDPALLRQFSSGALPRAIRRTGYVIRSRNRFTTTPGRTSSIAAPILSRGEIIAALAMITFAKSLNVTKAVARYVPDLLETARAIGCDYDAAV